MGLSTRLTSMNKAWGTALDRNTVMMRVNNIFRSESSNSLKQNQLHHEDFVALRSGQTIQCFIQLSSNIHPMFHPTFIQHSSNIHPTFIQHSSNIHPTFIQLSSNFHPTFIQHSSQHSSQQSSNNHPTFIQHLLDGQCWIVWPPWWMIQQMFDEI